MESLIVVLAWSAVWMAVGAVYCCWCERKGKQEGQALALSYIQHLQAARRIAIKNAATAQQKWLISAELFRDASTLQLLIESAQHDYPHDIYDIGRVRHGCDSQSH